MIEARVMRWLCDLVGYDQESFGTLASGGSEANLIALKCARDNASFGLIHRGVRSSTGRSHDLRFGAMSLLNRKER